MTFTNKLNYNVNGNLISDEVITLSGGNKDYVLLHHNLMTSPTQIEIWTGTNQTGTQITDFSTTKDGSKSWVYHITFGATVTDGTYYATYYSQGDENDADDINNIYTSLGNRTYQKQILHYVYNGNIVLTPTAVDTTTGNITVSEDTTGLSGGNIGAFFNNMVASPFYPSTTDMPKEFQNQTNKSVTYVDAHTVYYGIIPTSSGDLTKWHLEVGGGLTISNVFEPNKSYKVIITGVQNGYTIELNGGASLYGGVNGSYYGWDTTNSTRWGNVSNNYYGIFYIKDTVSPATFRMSLNIDIENYSNGFLMSAYGEGSGLSNGSISNWKSGTNHILSNVNYLQSLGLANGRSPVLGNGSIIDIYEIASD